MFGGILLDKIGAHMLSGQQITLESAQPNDFKNIVLHEIFKILSNLFLILSHDIVGLVGGT